METKDKTYTVIYAVLAVASVGCAVKCFIDGRLAAGIALCVLAVGVGLFAIFRKKLFKEDE